MIRKTERQQLPLHYNWRATLTKPGTRKYDDKGNLLNSGEIIKVIEGKNLIVTVGKAYLGNMLIDLNAQHDVGITWCALGASNAAPIIANTQLIDEGGGAAMRKAVTSKTQGVVPNTNQFTWSTFFTAAESTLAIEEAGMFGSSTAGAGENSGILFSRWLVSIDNSLATSDVTIDWVLTIG